MSLPTTQKVVAITNNSSSPFRVIANSPVPKVSNPHDIVIKVHAAGLNPVDFKIALYNWFKVPLPAVIGYDVSGVVVAVGSEVKDYKIGSEVFGNLLLTTVNGAFAEYAVVHSDTITHKPASVSHVDAASIGVAFLSAYDGYRQVEGKVNSDTTVFVSAATGGVGHFAVQLFKLLGAKVAGSAGTEDGKKLLKDQFKVDEVFDYKSSTYVEDVRKWSGGKGVDIVYDSSYQPKGFLQTAAMVKEGGQWIVLGSTWGAKDSAEAKAVEAAKGHVIVCDLGQYSMGSRNLYKERMGKGLELAAKLLAEGKLLPWLGKVIQLEEIIREQQNINTGKGGNGKIVAKIAN